MQLFLVSAFWKPEDTEIMLRAPRIFRPTHLRTHATEPGEGVIDGIFHPGSAKSQLVGEIDAYAYSSKLFAQMQQEFLAEYGLTDKTDAEIQAYLDDNELSMPDLGRIHLPTLKKDEGMRFTGRFKKATAVGLLGWVL
jgi:hypothetical protein